MARIWMKRSREGYRVTVAGHLGASDLRRLERACGPALEQRSVALQLDLSAVTGTDPVSDAFVGRLGERGARIFRQRSAHPGNAAPAPNSSEGANDA
jgi:hypothetical protein